MRVKRNRAYVSHISRSASTIRRHSKNTAEEHHSVGRNATFASGMRPDQKHTLRRFGLRFGVIVTLVLTCTFVTAPAFADEIVSNIVRAGPTITAGVSSGSIFEEGRHTHVPFQVLADPAPTEDLPIIFGFQMQVATLSTTMRPLHLVLQRPMTIGTRTT